RPTNQVAVHVGDRHLSVVESGKNIGDTKLDVLGVLCLDDLFRRSVFAQKCGGSRRSPRDWSTSSSRGGGVASLGWFSNSCCSFFRGSGFLCLFFSRLGGLFSFFGGFGFGFLLGSGLLFRFVSHTKSISGCPSWRSDCVARRRSCAD